MINIQNGLYIYLSDETKVTNDYVYYKVQRLDQDEKDWKDIFVGKLYKSPKTKTFNGVEKSFYANIRELVLPYFQTEAIEATASVVVSFSPSGCNHFRVIYSNFASFTKTIETVVFANCWNYTQKIGEHPTIITDNNVFAWWDWDFYIKDFDSSKTYYLGDYLYAYSNRVIAIPYQYTQYGSKPVHNIKVFFQYDKTVGETKETVVKYIYGDTQVNHPFYGGWLRISFPNTAIMTLSELDKIDKVENLKIVAQGVDSSNNVVFQSEQSLYMGKGPNVTYQPKCAGEKEWRVVYCDARQLPFLSWVMRGSNTISSSAEKSTYIDEYFNDHTYRVERTDKITLNTGWITSDQAKDLAYIVDSKSIKLYETVFGVDSFVTYQYDVKSAKNTWEDYQFLRDKKLCNMEFEFELVSKTII